MFSIWLQWSPERFLFLPIKSSPHSRSWIFRLIFCNTAYNRGLCWLSINVITYSIFDVWLWAVWSIWFGCGGGMCVMMWNLKMSRNIIDDVCGVKSSSNQIFTQRRHLVGLCFNFWMSMWSILCELVGHCLLGERVFKKIRIAWCNFVLFDAVRCLVFDVYCLMCN